MSERKQQTESLLDAPYKNSALPVEKRVEDLLSRMSLDEKVAQMQCVWNDKNETLLDEKGFLDPVKARKHYAEGYGLGQETGRAVADVLFGEYNPGGKLPTTIPLSVGHVPSYYNHKPSARRGYLFDIADPIYAFGFGLSYTRFKIGKPKLEKSSIGPDEKTLVRMDVTNTGKREGDEVIQMYVRDKISSVTRPVKELKGFKRVNLKPGEKKNISLEINPESLAFYDINMEYVVEPGEFEIMVGTSSRDEDLQTVLLNVQS